MTELQQPLSQLQETSEPLLDAQKMQFWLDKAVAWDQAGGAHAQKDILRHLRGLTDFLKQVLAQISNIVSCFCNKLTVKIAELLVLVKKCSHTS